MNRIEWVKEIVTPGGRVRAGFTNAVEDFNLGFHVGDITESVRRNREALAAELGVFPAWMNQVHSAHLERVVPAIERGPRVQASQGFATPPSATPSAWRTYENTDGLILDSPAQSDAACVMVADCIPFLLLGSSFSGAAVHVGRAGLLAGIAPKAVASLAGQSVTAVIGPAICGSCYEVPPVMQSAAELTAPGSAAVTRWATPGIDLKRALKNQLERAGVVDIIDTGVCTLEDPHYFSHRRSTKTGQPEGRFVGVIHLIRDTPGQLPGISAPTRIP